MAPNQRRNQQENQWTPEDLTKNTFSPTHLALDCLGFIRLLQGQKLDWPSPD